LDEKKTKKKNKQQKHNNKEQTNKILKTANQRSDF
jgi:hypothetical protein